MLIPGSAFQQGATICLYSKFKLAFYGLELDPGFFSQRGQREVSQYLLNKKYWKPSRIKSYSKVAELFVLSFNLTQYSLYLFLNFFGFWAIQRFVNELYD